MLENGTVKQIFLRNFVFFSFWMGAFLVAIQIMLFLNGKETSGILRVVILAGISGAVLGLLDLCLYFTSSLCQIHEKILTVGSKEILYSDIALAESEESLDSSRQHFYINIRNAGKIRFICMNDGDWAYLKSKLGNGLPQ
ncbi:hypothetical protein [Nevskia sp.]|uniref:hypothetical protein n=1 Tax=Nevskia sp. TaxID=1929292 RepID=UPI0025E64AC0|nr:hypothetical protein [Nevskia sp.]